MHLLEQTNTVQTARQLGANEAEIEEHDEEEEWRYQPRHEKGQAKQTLKILVFERHKVTNTRMSHIMK